MFVIRNRVSCCGKHTFRVNIVVGLIRWLFLRRGCIMPLRSVESVLGLVQMRPHFVGCRDFGVPLGF